MFNVNNPYFLKSLFVANEETCYIFKIEIKFK
jgi:hypothetical protein